MAKVSVVTQDKTSPAPLPQGFSGKADSAAYLEGENDPLHLYLLTVEPGETVRIGPRPIDSLAYVWKGSVEAGGRQLPAGSSLIVEHGETISVTGGDAQAQLLCFSANAPDAPRAGGHVHLLPADRVARVADMGSGLGVRGGMHYDSGCPTCEIWLHENHFGPTEPLTPEQEQRGVHSHTEDEIIFVIDGQIKLGNRLCGPGTALAIAANTMYSFQPGPNGLSFINFRAGTPGDIHFANGMTMSEIGNWQGHLGGKRPEYLEPVN